MSRSIDIAIQHPGLIDWLAHGRRGLSSNSMVKHLTGIPTEKTGARWDGELSHPYDPDDLDRCLALLDQVPTLRPLLKSMRTASKQWAALIDNWEEIEQSHLAEVGLGWTKGNRAQKTCQLMQKALGR